jgi:hypothetical protein
MRTPPTLLRFFVTLAIASTLLGLANAQTPTAPVTFKGQVEKAQLPAPPDQMVWNRIEAIDVAVLTPVGWNRVEGRLASGRVFGFSDKPLNAKRQFERGLTVKTLWIDNSKGQEVEAVDELLNQLTRALEGTPETTQLLDARTGNKAGKIISVVRVRTALPNETPEIGHALMIGDPSTGLVYQFLYVAPESEWEANWKIAEKILNNVFIQFPS